MDISVVTRASVHCVELTEQKVFVITDFPALMSGLMGESGNNCRSEPVLRLVGSLFGNNSCRHTVFRPFSSKKRVDINRPSEISLRLSHRIQL